MPFLLVQPEHIHVAPLQERKSKSRILSIAIDPDAIPPDAKGIGKELDETVNRILQASKNGAAVILAFGAHLVKNGLAPVVIRLMQEGWVTHVATNGAGGIHDWEFAWLGRSEEDVRENVAHGQFGTWLETGKYINLAVQLGALRGMGYGESLGALIHEDRLYFPSKDSLEADIARKLNQGDELLPARLELLQTLKKFDLPEGEMPIPHPFKEYSIFGKAFELGIPCTVHPGIGYDIIYNNPFANGAALGRAAHTDFKIMVHSATNLTGGVFLSVGSAIMAPQVFEKSISFANNLKLQHGKPIIHDHFMLVNDLQEGTWDWSRGEPPKSAPDYYFRFLKSFYRMGGDVSYVAADNRVFLHNVYARLKSS